MQVYEVGGAVRDGLLGLPISDRDWVVVGATPAQMIAAGFRPVGKDFPVFLHPQSGEEYALARTERKVAPGYGGFVFHTGADVTLEQDLMRRDLTINAMARRPDGQIIDPSGGRQDLASRTLRHVSDAFTEDPLRVLRVARFAARFADFSVAPLTLSLMRAIVESGEIDALVAERCWQELSRGLMTDQPSRMFDVLSACGALARLAPEFGDALSPTSRCAIDEAARRGAPLPVRLAALTGQLSAGERADSPLDSLLERWRVPTDCRELAVLVSWHGDRMIHSTQLDAEQLVDLLERVDALRRPARCQAAFEVCRCIAACRQVSTVEFERAEQRLRLAIDAMRAVDAGAIAKQVGGAGEAVRRAVRDERVRSVRAALGQPDPSRSTP